MKPRTKLNQLKYYKSQLNSMAILRKENRDRSFAEQEKLNKRINFFEEYIKANEKNLTNKNKRV